MSHHPYHRPSTSENIGLTFALVLFVVFAILYWSPLLNGAPLQRMQCQIERTCWIDAEGYLHKQAPPGCPDPSDSRACAAYKQSLAWQGEAQSYPHLDGVTLPKQPTRIERFKRWWRTPCGYPWCWGVERNQP